MSFKAKRVISVLSLPILMTGVFFMLPPSRVNADVATGLVGYWKFDENSGTTAADSSGSGKDGTLTNSPTWTNGLFGSALNFTGTNKYVNVPSWTDTANVTAAAWIKTSTTNPRAEILENLGGSNQGIAFNVQAGKVNLFVGAGSFVEGNTSINDGEWHLVAATYDGTDAVIYVDGKEDGRASRTRSVSPGTNLRIGVCAACGGGASFDGIIDSVRMYNRALSAADIRELIGGPGNVPGGLGLWLKADAGTSSTTDNTAISAWNDKSSNALNVSQGTAGNQPTFKNNATDNINFNPVASFDGANDHMLNSGAFSHNVNVNGEDFIAVVLPNSNPDGYANILSLNGGAKNGTQMRMGLDRLQYLSREDSSYRPWVGLTNPDLSGGATQIVNGSRGSDAAASIFWNGKEVGTGSMNRFSTMSILSLGAFYESGAVRGGYFNGRMAEVVFYTSKLGSSDRAKINSYLAVKYGITLDQSTATNYVASDGSVIWDAAANGSYKNDITGIGRDDSSFLNQKQSKSSNTTNVVTMGLGSSLAATNTANANTFSIDKSFMMWAHDNGAVDSWSATGVPTNYSRINRTWRVSETGTVGSATVSFNVANTNADIPNAVNNYYLLRDSDKDGIYTDETPVRLYDDGTNGDLTAGDNQYTANSVNFSDGETFTLAMLNGFYSVDITPVDNLTGEDGETGSFKVSLGLQPSAPVTIALSSSNTNEGTVPASITIQPENWNNPDANVVTVTGVNDSPAASDGSVAYTIVTGDVTSTDPNFDSLTGTDVEDVSMENQNDDPPGFRVIVVDNNAHTSEAGGTVKVRFELLSQPTADVTIPLSISDTSEGTLNGVSSITITPANWNQPQNNEVTITGVDDDIYERSWNGWYLFEVVYSLVTGDPTSADAGYDALVASDVANIALINDDNDTFGVTVNESASSTNVEEGGATDTISVVLQSQPHSGKVVVINVTPNSQLNLGSGAGTAIQLTFDETNWDQPQTVTVTAVDDSSYELAHTGTLSFAVDGTATTENIYDYQPTSNITANITDNDGDNDGILNSIEDAGPGSGDGNDDGLPDAAQANVVSFVSQVTDKYVTLQVDEACQITAANMVTETSYTVADSGFDYPFGLMNFTVDCGTSGYTTHVTQYYHDESNNSFVVRKHNTNTHAYFGVAGAALEQTTTNGQTVTKVLYEATDGGELDMDATSNGVIVDPAGLAQGVVGAPNTGLGHGQPLRDRLALSLATIRFYHRHL